MMSYLLNMVIFHSCVQLPEGTSGKNIGNGGDRCGNVKPHGDKSEIGQSGKLGNPTLQETTSSLMENLIHKNIPFPAFENH